MTRPLANDLRVRLVDAVAAGLSCRAAAERYGVLASTAVKWVRRWRDTGVVAACPQGGDKRSARIESHAAEVLGLIAAKVDITLAEREHGARFAPSTIWRFLDRHAQTFKKKPRTPASKNARTW